MWPDVWVAALGRRKSAAPATSSRPSSATISGEVVGSYDDADLGDLTPAGNCRENGCTSGPDGAGGGREQAINGAGCGSVQVRNEMWLNAGVSASGAVEVHDLHHR